MAQYRYIPILRWKRGEKVGVKQLSAPARQGVAPLFMLGTDTYVGKKETLHRPATPAPVAFAAEVQDVWQTAPFYLDATAIVAPAIGHHALVDIATSARAQGLSLIPARRLSARAQYEAAVAAVAAADNRGVALRIDLAEFANARNWISQWPFSPSETDLIVDLTDNVRRVAELGAAIDPVFLGLHQGTAWRSVTICGTSMPENFTGFAAGSHKIGRHEFALWQHLSSVQLPYRLDYADYTTVPVVPPPSGIRYGFPINVRYTLATDFLICRGVNTRGPGAVDQDVQLRGHAVTIAGYAGRAPLPCWADQKIDQIAAHAATPQGLEHWVQLGVNRHIELTRHQLP